LCLTDICIKFIVSIHHRMQSMIKITYVGDIFQKVIKLYYHFENMWLVQLAWNSTVTHGQTMWFKVYAFLCICYKSYRIFIPRMPLLKNLVMWFTYYFFVVSWMKITAHITNLNSMVMCLKWFSENYFKYFVTTQL
jgi:hypothetical protein